MATDMANVSLSIAVMTETIHLGWMKVYIYGHFLGLC